MELIIVIAITGVLAAGVALFIRRPMESYVDATRRAELTDVADTALRRITRDLRRALPNSVRVQESPASSGIFYLEYIQTTGGGRYRADVTSTGTNDPLDFAAPDAVFEVLGPMPTGIVKGDRIVVYNLGPGSGTTDAYTGANTAVVTDVAAPLISIASTQFPFPSPGRRFQSISGPVTYVCNPAGGFVRRISGYALTAAQPNDLGAVPLSSAPLNALLATGVTACEFVYTAVTQRAGTVAMSLQISRSGESVRLFQQVHVNNVP